MKSNRTLHATSNNILPLSRCVSRLPLNFDTSSMGEWSFALKCCIHLQLALEQYKPETIVTDGRNK